MALNAFQIPRPLIALEGIKENLITQTINFVFPDGTVTNGGIAYAQLRQSFGASVHLLSVFANATHSGLYLALINQDPFSSPIVGFIELGHQNIISRFLSLEFDIDLVHIIILLGTHGACNPFSRF